MNRWNCTSSTSSQKLTALNIAQCYKQESKLTIHINTVFPLCNIHIHLHALVHLRNLSQILNASLCATWSFVSFWYPGRVAQAEMRSCATYLFNCGNTGIVFLSQNTRFHYAWLAFFFCVRHRAPPAGRILHHTQSTFSWSDSKHSSYTNHMYIVYNTVTAHHHRDHSWWCDQHIQISNFSHYS